MISIRFLPAAVLSLVLVSSGCSSMTPTDRGVLGGGAVGAGTGAVIGSAVGHTGAGAAIGGAIGAISGGLVGNEIERSEQRSVAAAQAHSQIGMGDVIAMAHNHVSDPVIIQHIRTAGTVFHLSAQDVLVLKQNGVSDVVVQEMMATAHRVPPRHAYGTPVYVVEPPPPPVAVGVGFGFRSGGRCCR